MANSFEIIAKSILIFRVHFPDKNRTRAEESKKKVKKHLIISLYNTFAANE